MEQNPSIPIAIQTLLRRSMLAPLSAAEQAKLRAWREADPANEALAQRFIEPTVWGADLMRFGDPDVDRAWAQLRRKQGRFEPSRRIWSPWVAAAAVLLLVSMAALYWWSTTLPEQQALVQLQEDKAPAMQRAVLMFSDGQRYELDDRSEGVIQDAEGIRYSNGGVIVGEMPVASQVTLHTPRGGHYRLQLPDGTVVLLNAGATLRYPTQFNDEQRIVELEGEAYFEVTHRPEQPFMVRSQGQEIEVLGTAFNVYAYAGEPVQTTLVAGKVSLTVAQASTDPVLLQPGQQAIQQGSGFFVSEVDTDAYTGWMKGLFVFNDASLEHILREIERWYDVEISYPAAYASKRYYVEMPRTQPLSQVLGTFARINQLQFEQKGRRIIVKE